MVRAWVDEIDDKIIDEIGKVGKISSGKLKRSIEKYLKRKISSDVFSRHIRELTSDRSIRYATNPVLNKEDEGRFGRIFYSFTPDASARYGLELPIRKLESNREFAYQLLFMYIKNYDPYHLPEGDIEKYTFTTEEQFNSFLSRIQLSREDFQITPHPSQSDGSFFTEMFEGNKNVLIGKWEYPKEARCSYWYILPGISPKGFVKGTRTGMVFEHIQFAEPEIQKVFNVLEKEGLISKIRSPVLELLNEDTRYDFTDEHLREFINHCWRKLFGGANSRMMFTWKTFRNPYPKEKEWYRIVWGPKRANVFFAWYYDNLKSLKKAGVQQYNTAKNEIKVDIKRMDKSLLEEFNRLNGEHHNIVEKYPYPSTMLLELVYPQFLRELHETGSI